MIYIILILNCLLSFFLKHLINKKLNTNKYDVIYYTLSFLLSICIFFSKLSFINKIQYLLLFQILYIVIYTDIINYIIYDSCIICGIILNIIISLINKDNIFANIINGLYIPIALLLICFIMKKILNKETIGGGDIKLLFMLGMYFNLYQNLIAILISSAIALIYILITKRTKEIIPFGPFISLAYILLTLNL